MVLQKKHCKTITVPIQIYNLPKYTSRLQCIAKSLREYFHSSLVKLFGFFLKNVRYYRGSARLTSLIENTRYFGSSVAYNLRGIHLLIKIQNLRSKVKKNMKEKKRRRDWNTGRIGMFSVIGHDLRLHNFQVFHFAV